MLGEYNFRFQKDIEAAFGSKFVLFEASYDVELGMFFKHFKDFIRFIDSHKITELFYDISLNTKEACIIDINLVSVDIFPKVEEIFGGYDGSEFRDLSMHMIIELENLVASYIDDYNKNLDNINLDEICSCVFHVVYNGVVYSAIYENKSVSFNKLEGNVVEEIFSRKKKEVNEIIEKYKKKKRVW